MKTFLRDPFNPELYDVMTFILFVGQTKNRTRFFRMFNRHLGNISVSSITSLRGGQNDTLSKMPFNHFVKSQITMSKIHFNHFVESLHKTNQSLSQKLLHRSLHWKWLSQKTKSIEMIKTSCQNYLWRFLHIGNMP